MIKFLLTSFIFILFTTYSQADSFWKYKVRDKIKNEIVLDKKMNFPLGEGEWEIIEKTNWCWYAFCGKYISLARLFEKEIVETYSLGYLDTAGKRISDVNIFLYESTFLNKYDGCYKRPEYYKLELYHKGSTINCMIVAHVDVNKELYNPDDKTLAYLDANIIRWIEDNDIEIPKIALASDHIFFSRTVSPRYYAISHSINPKFFNGPKIKFFTEERSEYHQLNINEYPHHKKFIDKFLSNESFFHKLLEDKIKLNQYQKLDLAKYSPEKNSLNNEIESGKTKNKISNEDIKKLKDLKKLLDDGVLTQEEFDIQKKKLLK